MFLSEKVSNIPLVFIDTQIDLSECLKDLSQQTEIAFDLEFDNNRFKYGFHLCLIQISTHTNCYIIDPIAIPDLSELFFLFENKQILKIVHCPGEDLRLLHSLGCFPQNLFDTEICAKLLNFEITSLTSLLAVFFDHVMDKKLQTSNWHQRPLSNEQIQYAALDVLFLPQLRQILLEKAEFSGLMPYLLEEFEYLNQVRYIPEKREIFLTKADLANLSPYDQYVLNELLKYRDVLGAKFNMPTAYVISNELIREFALGKIDLAGWKNQRGLFSGVKSEAFGNEIHRIYIESIEYAEQQNLSKIQKRTRWYEDVGENNYAQSRKELDALKQSALSPVNKELARRYGEHTVKFIFGEGMMNDIVRNNIKISNVRGAFRRNLILSVAKDLGIDLSVYV